MGEFTDVTGWMEQKDGRGIYCVFRSCI